MKRVISLFFAFGLIVCALASGQGRMPIVTKGRIAVHMWRSELGATSDLEVDDVRLCALPREKGEAEKGEAASRRLE